MAYGLFEELEVWKRSCRVAVQVYEMLTEKWRNGEKEKRRNGETGKKG